MIQKYKDFWKQYSPYKLHPKDADIISQFSGTDELVVDLSLHMLEEKYDDFKNGNNNIQFLKDINLNAIHSNMYCKSFIGNPETAKLVILYGNPGLDLGDYKDEHLDKEYIGVLNKELNFNLQQLTKLKEGLGPKDVPQGENTKGYDILSNEDWTFLENQITQRDKAQVDSAVAADEGRLITAMAGIENKTINPETGETWTPRDLEKLLQDSLVSKDSKIYKQAEKWNPHASDKNAIAADEARVKPEWDVADQSQRTNLIASVDSDHKKVLIAEDNRIKAFDSSISLKNGNYLPTAINDVKHKVKDTIKIAGAATSNSQEETAKLLNRNYNRIKNKLLNDPRYKDTSFDELNKLINREFGDWKDQLGWNLPAGDKQGGILTRTETGEFPGVMILIDAENEKSKGSTASSTHGLYKC